MRLRTIQSCIYYLESNQKEIDDLKKSIDLLPDGLKREDLKQLLDCKLVARKAIEDNMTRIQNRKK